MAIQSWSVFERLQKAGVIPAKVRFQICIPTPIAPTYNNMVPGDRPALLPALTRHFIGEIAKIASALPNDRIALQWDVCQEVLAWEGYYEKGPVDFRTETLSVLKTIGDAVPAGIELGYHLCYGSPADEHCVRHRQLIRPSRDKARRLGGVSCGLDHSGNAADFGPDPECLRPGGPVLGGSGVIAAAEVEEIINLIVG